MSALRAVVLSVVLVNLISTFGDGNVGNSSDSNDDIDEANLKPVEATQSKNSKAYPCSEANPERCPSNVECDKLGTECLSCQCSLECQYGSEATAVCQAPKEIECLGPRTFDRKFICQYCYQSDPVHHSCEENVNCDSVADPFRRSFVSNCTVDNVLICLGRRHFHKQKPCNWTGGHKWTTALLLSITLGGFGADR